MEEDDFSKNPAWNRGLIDFIAPFLRCIRTKFPLELHVDAARAGALGRMGGGPGHSIRKRPRPLPNMRVVELVGRYAMLHGTQRLKGFSERGVERNRRVEKEIAIFELNNSHACRERQRKSNIKDRQILEWAVNDPDVPREWLVLIKGFV